MITKRTLIQCWQMASGIAETIVSLKRNNTAGKIVEALTVLKAGTEKFAGVVKDTKAVWQKNINEVR